MQHAIDVILALLVGLLDLVVTVIAVIEHGARQGLARLGITGPPQTAILVVLAAALIILAFRLFGRVFAVLIALVLLLILLHALLGGQPTVNA